MLYPAGQITVREAIRITGYCQIHIYNLIRHARIKARKYKFEEISIHLIDRDSLLEYCREQERQVKVNEIER
jgi:hypothetical protein